MTRILVTGAAGFVGSRVVRDLRAEGHIVLTTDKTGEVDHRGDLADPAFIASLPDVDIVAHVAAVQYVTEPRPRFVRRKWFDRNNVIATSNLVDRYAESVQYLLLIGTSMMYSQTGRSPYRPGDAMSGEGVYSRSKKAAADLVLASGVPSGILVPTIIGGPGRGGLFVTFAALMARYRTAVRPGGGRAVTQMVHVDDVAALLALMIGKRLQGYVNAGGPDPLSIERWIELIQEQLGARKLRRINVPYWVVRLGAWMSAYRFLAREQVLMLGQDHVLDTSVAREAGWNPRHSNADILRDTVREWLDTNKRTRP